MTHLQWTCSQEGAPWQRHALEPCTGAAQSGLRLPWGFERNSASFLQLHTGHCKERVDESGDESG